jgi:hypothetical protein
VDQKRSVARLLEKANKYREFARWVGDRETVLRISQKKSATTSNLLP